MEVYLELLLSLCLVAICSLALYFYVVAWLQPEAIRSKLRQQGITGPPPSFLSGNLLEMKKLGMAAQKPEAAGRGGGGAIKHDYTSSIFPYFEQWRKEYGPLYLYSMGNVVALHVSHPDIVKEISLCTSLDLGKPSYMMKTHEPLFGHGILKSNGDSWAYQRKIIAPEFFSDKVKGMVNLMVDSALPLLKSWEEQVRGGTAEINVDQDLRNYSADVISRACFGSSYMQGRTLFSKLRTLQKAISESNALAEIPGLKYLLTRRSREVRRLNREINSQILKIVQEGSTGGDHPTPERNLLHAILRSASSGAWGCTESTDRFIIDNCKNIYFAGHETSAVSACWCLMLLGLHPEWQARARAEAVEVRGAGRLPDAASLQKMKTLTMVIQETLRLYPPGAFVARGALKDLKLGGVQIPKGVSIFVLVSMLHHDPNIWGADAHEFNPERFAHGVKGACKHPQVYVPFGAGPRTCLGQTFAMAELKVILSLILLNFSFSLAKSYSHSPVLRLIVEPEFGVDLLMRKIDT